jgi:uncharacterized membrane protein YsdA (DUF1294 family)
MEMNYGIYFVMIWLIAASLLGFALMGVDKQRARNKAWRIPERTLLLTAFLGGSFGSLAGMLLFHHKTKHEKFVVLVPLAILFDTTIAGVVLRYLL